MKFQGQAIPILNVSDHGERHVKLRFVWNLFPNRSLLSRRSGGMGFVVGTRPWGGFFFFISHFYTVVGVSFIMPLAISYLACPQYE